MESRIWHGWKEVISVAKHEKKVARWELPLYKLPQDLLVKIVLDVRKNKPRDLQKVVGEKPVS